MGLDSSVARKDGTVHPDLMCDSLLPSTPETKPKQTGAFVPVVTGLRNEGNGEEKARAPQQAPLRR